MLSRLSGKVFVGSMINLNTANLELLVPVFYNIVRSSNRTKTQSEGWILGLCFHYNIALGR